MKNKAFCPALLWSKYITNCSLTVDDLSLLKSDLYTGVSELHNYLFPPIMF